ncbi:MAG: CBS domain-containing protein [Nanoarchaeota archaeon]|nr:CBS domain-containing protein [Nanoarchaeota archaeon]
MKTGIKVGDAMTRNPIIVGPEEDVVTCARKMLRRGVGGVVVGEKHNLLGIITEKDVVKRIVAKNKSPDKTKAIEVMTKKLVTISPGEDIYDALVLMNHENIRRVPVVSGGKLIGLLTMNDILKIQPALFDIIADSIVIREEENKIREGGECDVCGTKGMLFRVGNRWLCGGCK